MYSDFDFEPLLFKLGMPVQVTAKVEDDDESVFQCPICHKVLSGPNILSRHIKNNHVVQNKPESKPFSGIVKNIIIKLDEDGNVEGEEEIKQEANRAENDELPSHQPPVVCVSDTDEDVSEDEEVSVINKVTEDEAVVKWNGVEYEECTVMEENFVNDREVGFVSGESVTATE